MTIPRCSVAFLCLCLLATTMFPQVAHPQGSITRRQAQDASAVGVIAGGADGTYIRIAADLATVLDGPALRILPIVGRGSLQNLRDILYLRGVDVGIVQMDAREALRAENLETEATRRLRYIARLYNEEMHVLARREIGDIRQLAGRKVNIDNPGSGTNLTARIVFEKLGIKPEFTTLDQATARAQLMAGEIDAALYMAGRPVRLLSDIAEDDRVHLLSVPFEGGLEATYFPAEFTAADYPRLIPAGRRVDTVAVGNILVCFNWGPETERYARVKRFVDALFAKAEAFKAPGRHPKWKEINLMATVPGWERVAPAEQWVEAATRSAERDTAFSAFTAYMTAQHGEKWGRTDEERQKLFRQFQTWERAARAGSARRAE